MSKHVIYHRFNAFSMYKVVFKFSDNRFEQFLEERKAL